MREKRGFLQCRVRPDFFSPNRHLNLTILFRFPEGASNLKYQLVSVGSSTWYVAAAQQDVHGGEL